MENEILDQEIKEERFWKILKKITDKIIEIYAIIVVWAVTLLIFVISIFGGYIKISINFSSLEQFIDAILK